MTITGVRPLEMSCSTVKSNATVSWVQAGHVRDTANNLRCLAPIPSMHASYTTIINIYIHDCIYKTRQCTCMCITRALTYTPHTTYDCISSSFFLALDCNMNMMQTYKQNIYMYASREWTHWESKSWGGFLIYHIELDSQKDDQNHWCKIQVDCACASEGEGDVRRRGGE